MNYLQSLKESLIRVLSEGNWTGIKADHRRVQLEWRADLDPGWGKPQYVSRVLDSLPEPEIVALARRCLTAFPDRHAIEVQNVLWLIEAEGRTAISEVTRIGIADALEGRKMHPHQEPLDFLSRFGRPVTGSFSICPAYAYDVHGDLAKCDDGLSRKNWERYTHRELLDDFGFQEWPDKRVFQFIEALVHPTARRGEEQVEWVRLLGEIIRADGFGLAETERVSNCPVFVVRPLDRGVDGRPKNLIFASVGCKPELGFVDAVNNDVVILKGREDCLIYEDPIGDDGLLWDALVAWWARVQGEDPQNHDLRRHFAERLQASMGSDAEREFFKSYFRRFARSLGRALPALIPQVYLHYDPVSIRDLRGRGEERRFPVQRMDFLMLLPQRVRVVLEIDGQQHYSDGSDARASPKKYAETVRGDRDLRLAGYEVYRFGGHELRSSEVAAATVGAFFERLFRRHKIAK